MSDERAAALRAQFDRAFAEALAPAAPASRDFLRVRVDGEPFAIALTEIASLHAQLHVVAVPTRAPELLGIAAVRTALVPIYDLRIALGASATAPPRWTVLVRGAAAGFAFDGFDGHARSEDRADAEARSAVRALVSLDGRAHPVIALGSLLEGIQARWTSSTGRRVAEKEP